ncbi:MAG: CPBP family intramembrane glutamic endopeptidase [Caulobacteraceae bacterium]
MTPSSTDPAIGDQAPRAGLLARASHWPIVRIVVYAVVLIAAVIASTIATNPFIPPAPAPLHHPLLLVRNLVSPLMLLGLYVLVVRCLERRPATELDPRKGAPLLLIGAVIGTAMMGAVYLVLWRLGLARFGPGTGFDGLGGGLALAFGAAVFEELLLRAVLFRILEEATGTTLAVVVSAVIFGLLHAVNPGATPLSTVAIAVEAGVLLALAYALTHNLWLAIGIHMSWNFAEGSLFGAAVSGGAPSRSLVRATLSGPRLLTGGAFGPEASVVSVIASLFVAAVILALILRRGGWRPRTFRFPLA